LDRKGFAANFVESELLVVTDNDVASFVQVRGSVPWLWSQKINLAYKPPIQIEPMTSTWAQEACERHMLMLKAIYGDSLVLLNLLNGRGFEAPLTQMYSDAVSKNQTIAVEYHHFDLNMRPLTAARKNLDRLFIVVNDAVSHQGFCHARWDTRRATKMHVFKQQSGIIRTNCLDCLDRTNMIEYIISNVALVDMLTAVGVHVPQQKAMDPNDFNVLALREIFGPRGLAQYRQLWVQNGDAIAFQCM
jgi:hypothetical protein